MSTTSPTPRITKHGPAFGPRDGDDDTDGGGAPAAARAWQSKPHPTLPLLATARDKEVVVYALPSGREHSRLTNGHTRSVRSVAWKPGGAAQQQLCLASGSFDSTAGLWRSKQGSGLETEVSSATNGGGGGDSDDDDDGPWDLELLLEGHESEIKSIDFSPSGQYIATCSRDKSVWIWEDVGSGEGDGDDDDWECVAVLSEHVGDVKAVAWCPEPGRRDDDPRRNNRNYSSDVLASASYDDTVRVWREDGDGEWVCVAALEGHEGTVWGLQWEPRPRSPGAFPRLLTWSADRTVRVWTLREEEEEADDEDEDSQPSQHAWGGSSLRGGIPNTMRRSLHEDWECTSVLPRAHDRDVYSATWSAESGLVASTGSDSLIVLYREEDDDGGDDDARAAAELDGDDVHMTGQQTSSSQARKGTKWVVLSSTANGHGPYEINHITWCKRYDGQGQGELLVTTGDDGKVQAWDVQL